MRPELAPEPPAVHPAEALAGLDGACGLGPQFDCGGLAMAGTMRCRFLTRYAFKIATTRLRIALKLAQ